MIDIRRLKIIKCLFIILFTFSFTACDSSSLTRKHGVVLKGRNISEVFQDKRVQKLALAAANGKTEEINSLIKSGLDVNYQGKKGITPLLWTFFAENKLGFESLLKNGANPNLMVDGDPMMRFFTEPVVEDNDDYDYKYDNAKFLELALKYGGDPNAVDSTGSTMLMIACAPGTIRRVELLIEYGADLEKRTPLRNETALLNAATLNQYEKVYYLLQKGANYTVKNKFGYDLVRIIEEEPFGVGVNPGTEGRNKTIQFLRGKGYKVIPYEDKQKYKR